MNPDNFRLFWQQYFPACPPVSHLFKDRLADRWFRIHSLPESKRYAETESETAELLERQNTLLLDLVGIDHECILVTGDYTDSVTAETFNQCPALEKFSFREFIKLTSQEFAPESLSTYQESVYLNLRYGRHRLTRGSLDEVLLCVADWEIVNFFVVNCERQRIFAPYDGGVDVILRDTKERDEFKVKYKTWLAPHSEGL